MANSISLTAGMSEMMRAGGAGWDAPPAVSRADGLATMSAKPTTITKERMPRFFVVFVSFVLIVLDVVIMYAP